MKLGEVIFLGAALLTGGASCKEGAGKGSREASTADSVRLDSGSDTQRNDTGKSDSKKTGDDSGKSGDSRKDSGTPSNSEDKDRDGFCVDDDPADCDDNNDEIYPGANERCDQEKETQKDYNCDGIPGTVKVFKDADGDGFGGETSPQEVMCPLGPGYATNNEDCDDIDANINPAATDTVGDGVDGDCDGTAN